MYITIEGIGSVPVQQNEYFSESVLDSYVSSMSTLKQILDKPQTPPYTPSPADYDQILAAVQSLSNLSHNGQTDGQGITSYINSAMAGQLNDVMKTLKAVGISASSSFNIPENQKIIAVSQWQGLASYGVEQILNTAVLLSVTLRQYIDPKTGTVVTIPPEHTMQSMLELDYVQGANEFISSKLIFLQNAVSTTMAILNNLDGLQLISNQLNIPAKPPFVFDSTGVTPEDYSRAYSAAANAYFTQIMPTAIILPTTVADLFATKLALQKEYSALVQQYPTTLGSPGSLALVLLDVIHDISAKFDSVSKTDQHFFFDDLPKFTQIFRSSAVNWILDGQQNKVGGVNVVLSNSLVDPSGLDSGVIQRRLALAITVASNLGDTQKDDVRRYFYVLQQFYESCAFMLDRISSALQKMGKGIDKA